MKAKFYGLVFAALCPLIDVWANLVARYRVWKMTDAEREAFVRAWLEHPDDLDKFRAAWRERRGRV